MIEKNCNLWAAAAKYRCVPTNGTVTNGEAEMTSGTALEATQRFIGLSGDLGRLIVSCGSRVQVIRPEIVAFPIKQYEWQDVIPSIVKRSAKELVALIEDETTLLPRFLGKDDAGWQEIEEILSSLPDNVIVIG